MSTVVACDPGLRGLGLAVFVNGELVSAEYVHSTEITARGAMAWRAVASAALPALKDRKIDTLVIEIPQIYRDRLNVNPLDLLEVAGAAGAVVGALTAKNVVSYLPRQWSGQVPKDIRNHKLLIDLDQRGKGEREKIRVPRLKSLLHNTLDAIGLGIYHLIKSGERKGI